MEYKLSHFFKYENEDAYYVGKEVGIRGITTIMKTNGIEPDSGDAVTKEELQIVIEKLNKGKVKSSMYKLPKEMRDPLWGVPNAKVLRKLESIMNMDISDKNFASEFMRTQCIKIAQNTYVYIEAYEDYLKATENGLSVGYIWFEDTDLNNEILYLKNGQNSNGNILSRISNGSYITRGKKIILDILIDDVFLKPSFDQKLNTQIQKDYKKPLNISVATKDERATKEDIKVPRHLLFDFPQLKRKSLENLTKRKITQKRFIGNSSQEECLTKISTNTLQYFLLDCVMRFGKSFMYYEHIKRQYHNKGISKIHAVFCHDTKTLDGWLAKAEGYYSDIFDVVILKDNKNFNFDKKVKKNTIVFISQQLISANIDILDKANFEKQIAELSKIKIKVENIFIDEAHNYFTDKWKVYYESIIGNGKIMLASGTAANIKIEYDDLFDKDNTHTDTLFDLMERLNRLFGIKTSCYVKRINISDIDSKFINISNLQSLNELGELTNPDLVDSFCDALFAGKSNIGKRFSPFFASKSKHFPALVDTVAFAKAMYSYLLKNSHLNIIPILVAGDIKDRSAKTESEVTEIIEEANSLGKKTITISCGSMIQGISIREWKEMINLSSKSTYEIFFQLLGRGFEFNDVLDANQNYNIVMWDYNPQRIIKVGSEFVQSIAKTNGIDIPNAHKCFFDILKIEDYVVDGNSFIETNTKELQNEISNIVNSQILNKGCRARLCTNTRQSLIAEMPTELMEFLSQTEVTQKKSIIKELKSYKSELDRQKTNFSKKSDNLELPKVPKSIKNLWENVIDGLSVYTERIDIVCEVMFKSGKIKSMDIQELLKQNNDELFIKGFNFPNKKIAKLFTEWLDIYGDKMKINSRLSSVDSRIPNLNNILDMSEKSFLSFGDVYEKIFTYGKADTQISMANAWEIIKSEFKSLKLKKDITINDGYAKSGSLILSAAYYLYNNSEKVFGEKLSKKQIIKMMNPADENIFFNQIISTMGFTETTNVKKDLILINPPYKRGLHIKIFNKAFDELEIGGTMICIHPSTQILNDSSSKEVIKFRQILQNNETNITFVNGNKIFDAGFFTPLSITRVKKTKSNKIVVLNKFFDENNIETSIYENINDIFIHQSPLFLSILKLIKNKMKKPIGDYLFRNGFLGTHYLNITTVSGHPPKFGTNTIHPDFYQLIYKADENNFNKLLTTKPAGRKENGGIYNEIGFNSLNEAKNGFEYLKTKFVRFCLAFVKTGQNLNTSDIKYIPYMDFTKSWNDETLFKYFGLNKQEINFINEYIPNWYEKDFK